MFCTDADFPIVFLSVRFSVCKFDFPVRLTVLFSGLSLSVCVNYFAPTNSLYLLLRKISDMQMQGRWVIKEESKSVFATSYLNFISDHFAITLRMSLTGAGFVDDPRLELDSSQIKRPIIHQSPVSTPKRSQRKPAAGTPTKKRRC